MEEKSTFKYWPNSDYSRDIPILGPHLIPLLVFLHYHTPSLLSGKIAGDFHSTATAWKTLLSLKPAHSGDNSFSQADPNMKL